MYQSIATGIYSEADPAYQGNLKDDHRKKPNLILDFGDCYFVDSLIRAMHYDEVLDSVGFQNRDTLWAMVEYYVLSNRANSHANTWYEGSFASILYPKADIHSQMFRAIPGNIVDVTTLSTTITTLAEYGVRTDFTMLDAGYVSEDNMRDLFSAGIEFVARLPEKNKNMYDGILAKGLPALKRPENLIEFNG